MLRDLLSELHHSPTASGQEIRSRLGLSRDSYEQVLSHLLRLGYVHAEILQADADSCPSGACKGCPMACQSSPALGPQTLRVTDRGVRFLAKREAAPTEQA